MKLALDASVLLTVFNQEPGAEDWMEVLIPDFLIAAHAKVQADRLAAKDRGYLRRYFPDLAVLRP